MKERHKRKEVYSLIIVSHTDNQSRQLVISASVLRFLGVLLILICMGLGLVIYHLSSGEYREYQLKVRIKEQEQRVALLEKEKAQLASASEFLTAENQKLQETIETKENTEEESSEEISLPRLYPSDGIGDLKSTFSEEEPYVTIGMQSGDNVVATGDGVIRLIDYAEGYVHSIEIEHADGYISRYLCNKSVEIKVSEGDRVKAREALFAITSDQTELDYQILLNNEPLNPFQVMQLEN